MCIVVDAHDSDSLNVMAMEYTVYRSNRYAIEVCFGSKDRRHRMEPKAFSYHERQCHEIVYVEIMFRNRGRSAFDPQKTLRFRRHERHLRNDEMVQVEEGNDEERLECNSNATDHSTRVSYNELFELCIEFEKRVSHTNTLHDRNQTYPSFHREKKSTVSLLVDIINRRWLCIGKTTGINRWSRTLNTLMK